MPKGIKDGFDVTPFNAVMDFVPGGGMLANLDRDPDDANDFVDTTMDEDKLEFIDDDSTEITNTKKEGDIKNEIDNEYQDDLGETDGTDETDDVKGASKVNTDTNNGQESPGYIFAKVLKKENALPKELDIDKGASMEEVKEITLKYWQDLALSNIDSLLDARGYTQENKEFVDYLVAGGDPKNFQKFNQTKTLSSLPIDGTDDEALNNRKTVILEMYKRQGVSDKRAQMLYDTVLNKEEDFEEAADAIKYLAEQDAKEIEAAKKSKQEKDAEAEKARLESKQELESIIDKGVIGSITLTASEKQKLKNVMWEPTEFISGKDRNGNPQNVRVTKYQKLIQEFDNNVEKQLLFVYLLANNFSLSKLVDKGKMGRDNELLENLGTTLTKTSRKAMEEGDYKPNVVAVHDYAVRR